jgi:hypothetical protein
MFQKHSASDINLRGTLFLIRAFFSITTAASRWHRHLRKRILEMQHSFLASLLQAPKESKEKI